MTVVWDQARVQGQDECASFHDTCFTPTITPEGMTPEEAESLLSVKPSISDLDFQRGWFGIPRLGRVSPAVRSVSSPSGPQNRDRRKTNLFTYCKAQARALGAVPVVPDGRKCKKQRLLCPL